MAVQELIGSQFQSEVLASTQPVLVEFYATWCAPCKMMAPVLDEVAQAVTGKAKVVKIDIDKAMDVANAYKVLSVPTLYLMSNGSVVGQWRGVQSKETLVEALTKA